MYSIPRDIEGNTTYRAVLENIPSVLYEKGLEDFYNNLPLRKRVDEKSYSYIMALPGFGLIVLIKNGSDLDAVIVKSLGQVLVKLANACNACLANEELERLHTQVEERNKELQQVIYAVSHDLRAPLINIQGYSKMLIKSVKDALSAFEEGGTPEEVKAKVAAIVDKDISESKLYILSSIHKMDSLLAGLLHLSRSTRAELKKEELDMNSLLSDVIKTFDFQITDIGAKLEVSELPSCYGDGKQINQVFSNLIDNALKYLDPERPGVIRISGRSDDGQQIYCVEDNGIGISAEYQKKVFEIFNQIDSEKDGEGLGLTIVSKILERHGGKVWVESEPGKGSRFYVSLPEI
jgi:signal transduction histidine kinase